MKTPPARNRRLPAATRAFSLVELLAVMGIVAVLTALSITAYQSLTGAMVLSQAAHMVVENLSLARQEALTQSDIVEVRFYQTEAATPGTSAYRVIRLLRMEPTAQGTLEEIEVGAPALLPTGIVISKQAARSTLVAFPPNHGTGSLPGYDSASLDYVAFRFGRDGGVNLPTDASKQWFITVCREVDANLDVLPSNFATVQVDPLTGQLQLFRP